MRVNSAASEAIVLVIVDGWTKRVFDALLAEGLVPELSDWVARGARVIPQVVGVVPSISISSHATLLSGMMPQDHGIPGHRWLDEGTRRVRNYIGPQARLVNGDLFQTAATAFECSAAFTSATQSIVSRGAQIVRRLPTQSPGPLLWQAGRTFRKHPSGIHAVWLPRGDAVAHYFGPNSPEVTQEMIRTCHYFGLFLETVIRYAPNARILFVQEHGHRAVNRHLTIHII